MFPDDRYSVGSANYSTRVGELAVLLHRNNSKFRILVMLETYFDESYESQTGGRVFVVAGWFGEALAWRSLEDRWATVLQKTRPRVKEFKAADCHAGADQFRTWSRRKRKNLVRKILEIVAEAKIKGSAEILLLDGPIRKHQDYLFCVRNCLLHLTALALKYPNGERVAYVIDEREKIKAEVERFRLQLRTQQTYRKLAQRVGPITFDTSSEILPLQAADFLAHTVFRAFVDAVFNAKQPDSVEFRVLRSKIDLNVYLWDGQNLRVSTKRGWRDLPPKTMKKVEE